MNVYENLWTFNLLKTDVIANKGTIDQSRNTLN